MRTEYDFSQGVRGKFYAPDAQFHLPIYLEPDIQQQLVQLAEKKGVDLSVMINQLLKKDLELLALF